MSPPIGGQPIGAVGAEAPKSRMRNV